MTSTSLRDRLKAHMGTISAIDAHEHLRTSEQHVSSSYTFFHLFIPYTVFDLVSAGMPQRWMDRHPANDTEAEQCWNDIEPIWPYVKHGSCRPPHPARAQGVLGDRRHHPIELQGDRRAPQRHPHARSLHKDTP